METEKARRERSRTLVAMSLLVAISVAPAVSLALEPPAPPVLLPDGASPIPLSFDAAQFANNTTSGAINIPAGETRSNLTITTTGGQEASIKCLAGCTVSNVRVRSGEAFRAAGGVITISNSWLEAQGTSGDHADVIQCYNPGHGNDVIIKNTMIRAYNHDATAGFYCSDGYRYGNHVLENVVFWGGPYGIRVESDGGTSISLKNVYFITGSFGYKAIWIDLPIVKWENVRWATIVDGKLVPGDPIPQP